MNTVLKSVVFGDFNNNAFITLMRLLYKIIIKFIKKAISYRILFKILFFVYKKTQSLIIFNKQITCSDCCPSHGKNGTNLRIIVTKKILRDDTTNIIPDFIYENKENN